MTNQQTDPTKAASLAQEIVKILISEDSETRKRAIQASMLLLGESPIEPPQDTESLNSGSPDMASFFSRDDKLKPADHAQLCAAYHFSLYGMVPFSLDELRAFAAEAGLVLPARLDMTLSQAGKGGKKLFQIAGKGSFKPTVVAASVFKDRWNVKPGKSVKSTSAVTK